MELIVDMRKQLNNALNSEVVRELVKALEFYADRLHWDEIYYDSDDGIDVAGDIQHKVSLADVEYKENPDGEIISACAGLRARAALEKLNKARAGEK